VVVTLFIGLLIGNYALFVISKILLTLFYGPIFDLAFGIIPYYFFNLSFLSAAVP